MGAPILFNFLSNRLCIRVLSERHCIYADSTNHSCGLLKLYVAMKFNELSIIAFGLVMISEACIGGDLNGLVRCYSFFVKAAVVHSIVIACS